MASSYDVCIVGAGASGLACAIECARELRRQGKGKASIAVFEVGSKPGRSILASGNGRCNFSNLELSSPSNRGMYNNAAFVKETAQALAANFELGVLPWFRSLGLVWRSDDAGLGMLYPYSNKASTVLDVLLHACERLGVQIITEVRIDSVCCEQAGTASFFVLEGQRAVEISRTKTAKGRIKRELEWKPFSAQAAKVVVAVGGVLNEEALAALVPGHKIIPLSSVLAPLDVADDSLLGLDGLRAKLTASVLSTHDKQALCGNKGSGYDSVDSSVESFTEASVGGFTNRIDNGAFEESGEILFRDYQISGILSFNLSRQVPKGGTIALDFVPDYDLHQLVDLLLYLAKVSAARSAEDLLVGMFAPSLASALVRKAGLESKEQLGSRKWGSVKNQDSEKGSSSKKSNLASSDLKSQDSSKPKVKVFPDDALYIPESDIASLASTIKHFELEVSGVSSTHAPQVHRGGLALEEIDPQSLESKKTPGLFVLGEALDIDGPCGGYNLDWAWTCGIVAGRALANQIL